MSSQLNTLNVTSNSYDVTFEKATPGNVEVQFKYDNQFDDDWQTIFQYNSQTDPSQYVYELYSGDPKMLNNVNTIKREALQDSGVNVDTLSGTGGEGKTVWFNVLVRDQFGNENLYTRDSVQLVTGPAPPGIRPNLISKVERVNSVDLTFESQPFDIQYERSGSIINAGVGPTITISNLADDTTFNWRFRYLGEGGPGDWITITFTTTQAAPTVAPVLSVSSLNQDGATLSRTSVSGAEDYELEIDDSDVWNSVGLDPLFDVTQQSGNTNYLARVRASNGGGPGPESNQVSYLTKPDEAPGATFVGATATTLIWNITAISGQSNVTYFAKINDGSFQQVSLGENEFEGLPSSTPATLTLYAANGSGDGPEASFTETTSPPIDEPVYDDVNFANSPDSITFALTSAGGPDYEFRYVEEGGDINQSSIQSVTGPGPLSNVVDNLLSSKRFRFQTRSTDSVTQSAWIEEIVQTDGKTFAETTPPDGSFQI